MKSKTFKVLKKEINDKNIGYKRVKSEFYLIVDNFNQTKYTEDANLYLYQRMAYGKNGKSLANKTMLNTAHIVCALYNFCENIGKKIQDFRSSDLKELVSSLKGQNNVSYLNHKIACWLDFLEWFYENCNIEERIFFDEYINFDNIDVSMDMAKRFQQTLEKNKKFKKQRDIFFIKNQISISNKKSLIPEILDTVLQKIKQEDIMKWGVAFFMWKSGCRISEALNLKLDQNFEKAMLKHNVSDLIEFHYVPKGQQTWGTSYVKYISADVFITLAKELGKERKKRIGSKKSEYFFINKHGKPMTYKNMQTTFKMMGISSHMLRYTYAEMTRKMIVGTSKPHEPTLMKSHEFLKRQLGHKGLETTLSYCYSGEPII